MSHGALPMKSAPKRLYVRAALSALLLTVAVGWSFRVGIAEDAANPVGLKGILPAATPAGILEATTPLPETWKPWADALVVDLTGMYEELPNDVAGQKAALEKVAARLATVSKSLDDARFKSAVDSLSTLKGQLKRRVELAAAIMETLEQGPAVAAARATASRVKLAGSAAEVQTYLKSFSNDGGWEKYLEVSAVRTATTGTESATDLTAIASAAAKLKGKDSLENEAARKFLAQPQFAAYEAALDGYIAAVNAPVGEAALPALRDALAALVTATEAVEAGATSGTAASLRSAVAAIRANAPDAGERIITALRSGYLNYNMRVVASEVFLNKLVAQNRVEQGGVTDFILGANVSGNQQTATQVGLDLIPSGKVAQFDIALSGNINSNTYGSTSQAVIQTYGNHYFWARKRIAFDGDKFSSYPATIQVQANNTTVGASTNYSGGLLGSFADRIAMSRAEEMRPESQAIAASRVQDQVLPRFNSEVDVEFGSNGSLNKSISSRLLTPLKETQLFPGARSIYTTDNELLVNTRLMETGEVGASDPQISLIVPGGATVQVHESLLNNATDRIQLAGRTMTESELKYEFETFLKRIVGPDFSFDAATASAAATEVKSTEGNVTIEPQGGAAATGEPAATEPAAEPEQGPKALIFAKEDPIRFRLTGEMLVVTLRAGFSQGEGKADIPTQVITVPIKLSMAGDSIVLERGDLVVSPLEKPDSIAEQVTRAAAIRRKLEAALPRRESKRQFTIKSNGKTVTAEVTSVHALDGWLTIGVK